MYICIYVYMCVYIYVMKHYFATDAINHMSVELAL